MLAPASRKQRRCASASGTGICAASAGRWTPLIRFIANSAAVIVAPVEPALTSAPERPSATSAAARTTEASGVERTAATGSASLPIHSSVGDQLDAVGRRAGDAGPKTPDRDPVGGGDPRALEDDLGAAVGPVRVERDRDRARSASGSLKLLLRLGGRRRLGGLGVSWRMTSRPA